MEADIDLLAIDRGSVTAPAGCGKTQLIANALTLHISEKPILILTHTNAGVVALRKRLAKAGVASKRYRLSTIDGWAMRVIRAFPMRSGHDPVILELAVPKKDYPKIREAAAGLVWSGHIIDVVSASYARVIVDEYQDCSTQQHNIILGLAEHCPTCVLGDPLQAIFGFAGKVKVVEWTSDVAAAFPPAGALKIPWRWKNVGAEDLGSWLLEDVRGLLEEKKPIDLRKAPKAVTWVRVESGNDHTRLRSAGQTHLSGNERALIMGYSRSPERQQWLASQIPGAIVVESVELKSLTKFAGSWELSHADALDSLCDFAQQVMIGSGAGELVDRVGILQRGKNKKPPTDAEKVALALVERPSHALAADLLVELNKRPGVRSHRSAVLRACIRALQSCDGTPGNTFFEAAVREREQNRLGGRPLPKRAVGSTLLLKGLEAEVAVVLDADQLDARNLYVAMTRGSNRLVVCSPDPVLRPHEVKE